MAEIDSAPRLNTVSRDKKSASVRHLMSRQILTRFDPDEKSAVLRQKIGKCAEAFTKRAHEDWN